MVELPGYKIERELGRGGMATVYQAIQLSVERRVALKVMSPVLLADDTFSGRFMREARIAANLYHPNIVAVHDVGVHDNYHYIAMEYLSGGDLAARCDVDRIKPAMAIRVVREIVGALHYAHAKGFVHRDVKPENILFREDGAAVLTDFGIARAVNSGTQMTRTGAVIGTPQYMSPEQARGKDLDGRSDFYSLGIVLYEMLVGKVPFAGTDSVAVGIKHVTEPVPRLTGRAEVVQPVLDRFLAKQPGDRYQNGGEALMDLQQLEASLITGQHPRVDMPTPRPDPVPGPPRETRISGPQDDAQRREELDTTTPLPVQPIPPRAKPREPINISPTPRPDGSLRQEPRLGALDEINSFDRTVSQPRYEQRKPAQRNRSRSPWRGVLITFFLVLAVGAALAWWQRDALLELLPGATVEDLLARADQAIDEERWFGQSEEYANTLYRRVLAIEPDNRRARLGLEAVANEMVDQAETALAAGSEAQARLYLERAAAADPELPRIAKVRAELAAEADDTPSADRTDQTIAEGLVGEARALENRGQLVQPARENALERYRRALELDPQNDQARAGIDRIRDALVQRFEQALDDGRLEAAQSQLEGIETLVDPQSLEQYRTQLAEAQSANASRQRIDDLLTRAATAARQGRLTEGDNSAAALYQQVLSEAPDSDRARQGLDQAAGRLMADAEAALEADQLDRAEQLLVAVEAFRPGFAGLPRAYRRLELYRQQAAGNELTPQRQAQLEEQLRLAREAMAAGRWMQPLGESAYDRFKAALSIDPGNEDVKAGMRELSQRLLGAARAAIRDFDQGVAKARYDDAVQTDPTNPELEAVRGDLAELFRSATRSAIEDGRVAEAARLFETASRLEPHHEDLARLQLQLSIARDGG